MTPSQKRTVDGHTFMTNIPDSPDLAGMAREAQAEILLAEAAQASPTTLDDAFNSAELGYYKAELRNLRDAATTLNEAEQNPE
jgi:hypothetical protein